MPFHSIIFFKLFIVEFHCSLYSNYEHCLHDFWLKLFKMLHFPHSHKCYWVFNNYSFVTQTHFFFIPSPLSLLYIYTYLYVFRTDTFFLWFTVFWRSMEGQFPFCWIDYDIFCSSVYFYTLIFIHVQ